jgi:hypothetical protein
MILKRVGMTNGCAAAYISHDDLIALEAAPAVPGEMMVCDIEVSLVFPGNRLAGRYQEGT